ncbi:hypothetical protein BJ170DRAFT_682184 [Xylariales sp. AK1849]|nr:hypothetical protein BJ170DRAFT_682184 [Xylariales sp. AK1849]
MEPKNAARQIIDGKGSSRTQRRASFSPMRAPIRALRSLSIGSTISNASDTDILSPFSERRRSTLRKTKPPEVVKQDLARQPSKTSSEDYTEWTSLSTTPSGSGSQGTSISGEAVGVVKSGALHPETAILKTKTEYLVLTHVALKKFKSRLAAVEQFPQVSIPSNAVEALSPVGATASSKDFAPGAELNVPLERVVAVFKDEGTKPCFGLEIWWKDADIGSSFASVELNFTLPSDRDEWLKQIQVTVKKRARVFSEDVMVSDVEMDLLQILEAKYPHQENTHLDIFPVVPRRPYSRLRSNSGEVRKGWREGSSFYLAFSKNVCVLAQFTKSPTGQRVNPNLVQFGLVTLSKVNASLNDERFTLTFRLPLDKPTKLELSSRYHRNIIPRLFKADAYLKPAWPLWTRREVFFIDGETQQLPFPEGEDYGGFKRTLDAFMEGYHCSPVNWKVNWQDTQNPPEFRLLPPSGKKGNARYTSHQLLAVFRALRFNDFFHSLTFSGIDFSALSGVLDNTYRLEPTAWLSRTEKRCLTRDEFEIVEKSPVLFQEIIALLLGSESIKHIDLGGVLSRATGTKSSTTPGDFALAGRSCEVVPPIILLLRSLQTRCKSVVLSGNPLGPMDISEIYQTLQARLDFMKGLCFSNCQLDDMALIRLWEGIHEQRHSLEILEVASNSSRLEAGRVSKTLEESSKLRRLDLAYCLKGNLDGPLFSPWTTSPYTDPWRLQELDLSGWKINFDTISSFLRYMELEESNGLRKLVLDNCGISGEVATAIFCRIGKGRDMHLHLSGNPLESGSTDWIDLVHGDETPRNLHLDMIQFSDESNFNRLLRALAGNTTIEFLSLVGTCPPARASSKTSELLSKFFETNTTLQFLDFSGYSGKLDDGQLGWGLSGALGGLKHNRTLRQLRIRNHDIGAANDVTDLCRVIALNKGLAMFDIHNNNFDHHQYSKLVHALEFNQQIISFPTTKVCRDSALEKEKRLFMKSLKQPTNGSQRSMSKSDESRLEGLLNWLKDHWDSEVRKGNDILKRNRDNPINYTLELDADCLDAWDDEDLPPWLKPSLRARDKGKATDTRRYHAEPLKASSFVVSSSPSTDFGGSQGRAFGSSEPALHTYTIEEEASPMSQYDQSPFIGTPDRIGGPTEDRGGPSSPVQSPVEYQQIVGDMNGRAW